MIGVGLGYTSMCAYPKSVFIEECEKTNCTYFQLKTTFFATKYTTPFS